MATKTFQNQYLVTKEIEYGAGGKAYLVKRENSDSSANLVIQSFQPRFTDCRSFFEKDQLLQESKKSFEGSVTKFQRLSRGSHCIPLIADYFTENYQFLIVQEKLAGATLGQQLQPHCPWSQKATVELLVNILDALNFCHQEGIVHQDLQPNNIWIDSDGNFTFLNFGELQAINQLTISGGKTVSNSVIGTEGYMAIEQMAGLPVMASDIHAVGVIGMQAITGLAPHEIPFDYDQGIPAWQKVPGCYVTASFAQVLNQMLADLPEDRYCDAATALAALQSLSIITPTSDHLNSPTFTFENAHLYYQPEPPSGKISGWLNGEISGMLGKDISGWLGIEEKPEPSTDLWQVKKGCGEAQRIIEELGNSIQIEMVYVPGNDFIMGAPDYEEESSDHERPQHTVKISDFYIGRYPVTQEQYVAVTGMNPACRPGAKLPIENVSWHDAQNFCQKLSARTDRRYQLPSEAQWEYACRGNTTTPFSFGETITTDIANFNGNYPYNNTPKGMYRKGTTAVDVFGANNFGLSDMHGNVWEWCADHWYKNYEKTPTDGTAAIKPHADINNPRVLRGGSWFRNATTCRAAARHRYSADFQFNDIGFRLVLMF